MQTTVTNNNDYRINVEIPGVTDVNQVRNLIGTTAQLTFWEQIASSSAKLEFSRLHSLNILGRNSIFKKN